MSQANRWLLPDGVSESLPAEAAYLEQLRRRLLDVYAGWGYELVIPPFLEYVESLLLGTGADLDLQTFKLTDQLTGRLMGIRADMTPQVARIAMRQLPREAPTRLCYLGTVLHTLPAGFGRTRAPLQIGAELYGYAGVAGDLEILTLLLETLRETGLPDFYLDVGHVAVYRSLARQAGLDTEREHQLFDALQRKAIPEIHQLLSAWQTPPQIHDMLARLVYLNGGAEILAEAREVLAQAGAEAQAALEQLQQVANALAAENLHFDLAELRGYSYHTGLLFAAYVGGHGQSIAQGGRYDRIGGAFGCSRPATGFTADLRTLAGLAPSKTTTRQAIFAPVQADPAVVAALRQQGRIVISALPGQAGNARDMGCEYELRRLNGQWIVMEIK
jgi:ATP phosphoribosyltransferase regulatory subunit